MNTTTASPQITIVMAAYQAGIYLREALDSILAQTISDWELIVMDDGSTDDTAAILEAYARQDTRIRWQVLSHSGHPGSVRNQGAKQAQGKYLVFWDADDRFPPKALQHYLSGFVPSSKPANGLPKAPIVLTYGFLQNMRADGILLKNSAFQLLPKMSVEDGSFDGHQQWRLPPHYTHTIRQIALGYFPATAAMMIDRQFFWSLGGFDDTLSAGEDMGLYLKAFRLHWLGKIQIVAIAEYLVHYRQQSSGITTTIRHPEQYGQILASHLQALEGLFMPLTDWETLRDTQWLNSQLYPWQSSARARRYAYVAGLCLKRNQRRSAIALLRLAWQDKVISSSSWNRYCFPMVFRAVLIPHALDTYLRQCMIRLRDKGRSRLFSSWKNAIIKNYPTPCTTPH